MSFLVPSLLAGVLLVALPIVLHLVMRREPQRVEFPALRFVRQRHATNQTRLRLRHWLLLALRCGLIALLAIALARPLLPGTGLLGTGNTGLAAALVFDTSPRMEYRQQNLTRLEQAQQLARWLLEQLPSESQVALVEPRYPQRAQLTDRDAALLRSSRLRTSPVESSLAEAILQAITLVSEPPDHRREVYVFTDLSQATWKDATLAQLQPALEAAPEVTLYLVDVGVDQPQNIGLGELELSAERLATGESLRVRASIVRTSGDSPPPQTVELWLENPNGEPEKRGEQVVALEKNWTTVEFPLAAREAGVHQGYVELVGSDPLPVDNRRHFTVEVIAPARVLLVGPQIDDTLLVREALAPTALAGITAPRFACEAIPQQQLSRTTLNNYDAVCLLDPAPLTQEEWRQLAHFVQSGGGLALFLGRHAIGHLAAFNSPAAQQLLPGPLTWVSTTPGYLQPRNYEHPLLQGLADVGPATPWPAFPVFKSWQLGDLDREAMRILSYADGSPAVVEGLLGNGHVLLMTTPLSDRAAEDPWNLLPTNPDPWPFLALIEGIADYLVGTDPRPLNYQAGQVVSLMVPRHRQLATYVLQPPVGDPLPQHLPPGQREIVVTNTDQIGNYRVVSGGQAGRLDRGFSTTAAAHVGQLDRVAFRQITSVLGNQQVELARDRRSLAHTLDLGRVGREFYPWLILLVALLFASEQWLADRFYRRG